MVRPRTPRRHPRPRRFSTPHLQLGLVLLCTVAIGLLDDWHTGVLIFGLLLKFLTEVNRSRNSPTKQAGRCPHCGARRES